MSSILSCHFLKDVKKCFSCIVSRVVHQVAALYQTVFDQVVVTRCVTKCGRAKQLHSFQGVRRQCARISENEGQLGGRIVKNLYFMAKCFLQHLRHFSPYIFGQPMRANSYRRDFWFPNPIGQLVVLHVATARFGYRRAVSSKVKCSQRLPDRTIILVQASFFWGIRVTDRIFKRHR